MRVPIAFAMMFFAYSIYFAASADLSTSYATELVLRDCAQKPFALSNRSELSAFYGKPVDAFSITDILSTVQRLSYADSGSKDAPLTYFTCGEYVMAAAGGKLFWRGIEVSPPAYVSALEGRVESMQTGNSLLQTRVFGLEQRVEQLQNQLSESSLYLSIFLIGALLLLAVLAYKPIAQSGKGLEAPSIRRHGDEVLEKLHRLGKKRKRNLVKK